MPRHATSKEFESEKPAGVLLEDAPVDEKQIEDGGDYSGAVKKTSPEEIKLVRKLDIRIMSILWAMYFLVSNPQSLRRPHSEKMLWIERRLTVELRTTLTATPLHKHVSIISRMTWGWWEASTTPLSASCSSDTC